MTDRDYYGMDIDSQGRFMKNHFATQLAFSIVEILLCCFSPTTMVLAIIALVFAIQANTAYVHGIELDFKVKSKVSSILLIVGGSLAAVSIICTLLFTSIFMFSADTFMREFNGDIEAFLDDAVYDYYEDDYMGESLGDGTVPLVEGYEQFTLNGTTYKLPMTYVEIQQMGYVIEEGYEGYILNPGDYQSVAINDTDGDWVGRIRFANHTNVVLPLEEGVVDYISFENKAAYGGETLDLQFADGLDMNSSYEDVKAFMGTPTYIYESTDGYGNYDWYYSGDGLYQSFSLYVSNGVISNITFEYDEYNEYKY